MDEGVEERGSTVCSDADADAGAGTDASVATGLGT